MPHIFTTTYEIIGEGASIAMAHQDTIDAAQEAQWAFTKELGALGFRPSHNGGVRSLFFAEVPTGWRKIGREGERVECVPRKNTKTSKEAAERIAVLPKAPQPSKLAGDLGYNPANLAIDETRGTIYLPSTLNVVFPVKRYFIRLPRFSGDGFEPDSRLRALPESEFMKVVEGHNAEARRQKEAA